MNKILLSIMLALCSFVILAPVASQITNFQDGNVLTASQLNNEFGNLYSTINNLDEDNFSASANLPATIVDSAIGGEGLLQDPGTGALDVQVDDSTVEIVTDTLQVKDDGITTSKILDAAVTSDKLAANAARTNIGLNGLNRFQIQGTPAAQTDGQIDSIIREGTSTTGSDQTITASSSNVTVSSRNISLNAPINQGISVEIGPVAGTGLHRWACSNIGGGGNTVTVEFLRDATVIFSYQGSVGSGSATVVAVPMPNWRVYDSVNPGSYTYTWRVSTGPGTTCFVRNFAIIVKQA